MLHSRNFKLNGLHDLVFFLKLWLEDSFYPESNIDGYLFQKGSCLWLIIKIIQQEHWNNDNN